MLTYDVEERGPRSLYEHLYLCIRRDIEQGAIAPNEKLPSKRALAKHVGVSLVTVEAAYAQLVAEGYVRAIERKGYFAETLPAPRIVSTATESSVPATIQHTAAAEKRRSAAATPSDSIACAVSQTDGRDSSRAVPSVLVVSQQTFIPPQSATPVLADFSSGAMPEGLFPFDTWAKTVREVLSHEPESALLSDMPTFGLPRLREALAAYLRGFRGIQVDPACIVVGAGAQTLYNMIVQLLGRRLRFAVEEPGYPRLTKIYRANDVSLVHVPLDDRGVSMEALRASEADVVHVMPSHQFPTGLITPVSRRYELLAWAAERAGRFVIEDDYDCEFRFAGRPIPTLSSVDVDGRVIYTNTFAKSLGPAFRIGYVVLPPHLAEKFTDELGFYSCTVSAVDQLTLARFIESGNYERHVNRMRSHCRTVRDALLGALRTSPLASHLHIDAADSGLHFVMTVDGVEGERAFTQAARAEGIVLAPLSAFCSAGDQLAASPFATTSPSFIMNYAATDPTTIPAITAALGRAFERVTIAPLHDRIR